MGLISRIFGSSAVPSILPPVDHAEIDEILNDLKTDIHRQNLISLGSDFTPEVIRGYRHRARYGDPRFLYALYDEAERLGWGPQKTKAIEAMKAARPTFVTNPEAYNDGGTLPEGADPVDVANARAARDLLEDILSPWITELISIHANQEFYGIADSKLKLNPRGTMRRFDSIEEIAQVPARRHRLDPITHEWMLMLSPDSWEGTPVADLLLKPYRGNEGLFFTELGAGSQHLDQRGLLFQCLVYWGMEQFGMRWWAKHVELFGVPPRIAYVDFAKPAQVASAKTGLANMGATSYAVLQEGTKVDLLQSSTGGADNPHETLITHVKRGYDAIILGHEQASGVQKGVGGKVQGEAAISQFEELTNSRLRTLAAQISRGLGKTLVARNLGADIAEQHAPILRLGFTKRDDADVLATIAAKLQQAGAGELISAEDLVTRCTLKLAEPGGKTLGPAVTSAPMPAISTPQGAGAGLLLVSSRTGSEEAPEVSAGADARSVAMRAVGARRGIVEAPVPAAFGAEVRAAIREVIADVKADDPAHGLHGVAHGLDRRLADLDVSKSGAMLAAAMFDATLKARAAARAAREAGT